MNKWMIWGETPLKIGNTHIPIYNWIRCPPCRGSDPWRSNHRWRRVSRCGRVVERTVESRKKGPWLVGLYRGCEKKCEKWQKGPWLFRVCRGLYIYILPSYLGIVSINHEIRIPSLTNQDSMESKRCFFRGSGGVVFLQKACVNG